MNPFFFGDSEKPLFGVYHPPRSRQLRDTSVVLCYPFAQEYMRSFKMFKRLADLLAKAGFHVLRFDYYGTGDSSGASEAWRLAQCDKDVVMAAEELKSLSGNTRVSLVGLRLGAAIAASTALKLEQLVLWDPVVNGRDYLASLSTMHQAMLLDADRFNELRPGEGEGELLGYPLSAEMRVEIEGLDLTQHCAEAVGQVAIIGSRPEKSYQTLHDCLQAKGVDVDYRVIEDAGGWGALPELESALLLSGLLQEIVMVLSKDAR